MIENYLRVNKYGMIHKKYTKKYTKRQNPETKTKSLQLSKFIKSGKLSQSVKLPLALVKLIKKYKTDSEINSKTDSKTNSRTNSRTNKKFRTYSNKSIELVELKTETTGYKYSNSGVIIGNNLNRIESVLEMNSLKNKFRFFFTLDYMNYLDLDIHKRKYSFSTTQETYRNHPITLEACLLVVLSSEKGLNKFRAHMLDKIKIITSKGEYYFPDNLPDSFPKKIADSFLRIYEIINQVYTILKYISIIICHNTNKPENIENAIEVINVKMKLYNDLNVILEECTLKRNWTNSDDDIVIYKWLDNVLFKPVLGKEDIPDLGLSTANLYKFDYYIKDKIPKPNIQSLIMAKNLERKDFNNKFIIVSSEFLAKILDDVEYQNLIKNLKKYNLKFTDLYSTPGMQSAFIWYASYLPSYATVSIIVQHYNTIAYLGNAIDSTDNINDKQQLFFLLKKLYPDEYLNFLADSFLLTNKTEYKKGSGGIFIARPVTELNPVTKQKKIKAASGKDIIYITDTRSLQKAKELLERYDNVLISQYIRNPLLFKGKKFHLRIYFVITWINDVIKTYLFDEAYIWTAKLPFVLDKFDNNDIHDTHYSSTEGDPVFPRDFTSKNMECNITPEIITKLLVDIKDIMAKVSTLLLLEGSNKIKMFSNLKNAFQIEGCDFMITKDFRPILLECNNKAGFSNKTIMSDDIQRNFFDFIDRNVLAPVYGNGDHKTDKPLFISKI